MRVVWIGGARNVEGIGMPCDGLVYDWPDHVAASLIEQGKAELAPPDPPVRPAAFVPKPAKPVVGKG
jgi:hypothetical protein